jgi:hypothetical protein
VNMLGREAHRLVDDARIEIDVRVELALDEIVVVERDLLELHRDFQQRMIALAELGISTSWQDLRITGARIVVLVDAVAEAHQAEIVVLVLHACHEMPGCCPHRRFP